MGGRGQEEEEGRAAEGEEEEEAEATKVEHRPQSPTEHLTREEANVGTKSKYLTLSQNTVCEM